MGETVLVNYPAKRDVFVDGVRAGVTNQPFGVETGMHTFDLGQPQTYEPPTITVLISGTDVVAPATVLFGLGINAGEEGLVEAERRIEEVQRSGGKALDLRRLALTRLPESLAQLTQLHSLRLGYNRLTSLPEFIGQLSELDLLDLVGNQLTALPESLGQLRQLEFLDLSENQLTVLPESLGQLVRLYTLYLYDNRLKMLPESLRRLPEMAVLFIHDNPGLRLPRSVLGPSLDAWNSKSNKPLPRLKPILDYYFRTRLAHDKRPLREAKLILVGRGEVGKTSLVKRLVKNKFSRREDRTQGIRITQWPLAVKRGEEVRMHVWDFGGQEIMHATHQFFLTDRSVYLLVLDGRAGQQEAEADYWMRIIASFAPESPVLVVLNKIRKDPFDLNRRALREKYPQVKTFIETDCDNLDAHGKVGTSGFGIEKLRKAIAGETNRLPDLRAPFPVCWFDIKEKLSKTRKNYLSFGEYRAVCAKNGELDEGAQESLATHLHRLGVALNFRDDRRLRETHVLNPHWVTEGIYALLNSDRLKSTKGVLRLGDMEKDLDTHRYPKEMYQFLLDLMEKFELCFSFRDRYLIPELLDPQQPKESDKFDPAVCLNFQYHYPVIPTGLLPRFIVRTHVLSEKYRWRTGVILDFEGNRALVKADLEERRVYIAIDGPLAGRQRMLAMIREDFDAIHRDIQHLNPAEMVPLPSHPQVTVEYHELEVLGRNDTGAVWQKVIGDEIVKIPVRDLLNGVDLAPLSSTEEPLRVFYSYAHVDAKQRLRLDKHLSPLKRLGLITDWYDNEILPGDVWAEEIEQKIKAADIVLLLVSPYFVDSYYCYEIEHADAMKKHRDGTAEVIPIIVATTHGWTRLPFGRLNALPTSGKPIPNWKPNQDAGWANVAAGIERVAEELMERRETRTNRLGSDLRVLE